MEMFMGTNDGPGLWGTMSPRLSNQMSGIWIYDFYPKGDKDF